MMTYMEPATTPTLGQTIATPVPANLADMIVKTPGTCGGRARVAGTRIKVEHIYNWVEHQGMTPAEVVKEFPHLSKAQVHAALAYYWSHVDEIQRDMAEGDELVADMRAKAGPSKLQEKLAEVDGKDNPLSPG
jgi:uncharacterized protein (DUF433 family)